MRALQHGLAVCDQHDGAIALQRLRHDPEERLLSLLQPEEAPVSFAMPFVIPGMQIPQQHQPTPEETVLLAVPESGRFSFAFAHLTVVAPRGRQGAPI